MSNQVPRARPRPGETWRHWKGNTYQILATGRDEKTGAHVVIYQSEKGDVWVRELTSFLERIPSGEPRFAILPSEVATPVIARNDLTESKPLLSAQYFYFKRNSGKWKYDGYGVSIPESTFNLTHARLYELNGEQMPGIRGRGEDYIVVIIDPNSWPRLVFPPETHPANGKSWEELEPVVAVLHSLRQRFSVHSDEAGALKRAIDEIERLHH